MPAAVYLEGEYGVKGVMFGVPVILGAGGGPKTMKWIARKRLQSIVGLSVLDGQLRLAHVALVMIPLINIVFGREIDKAAHSYGGRRTARNEITYAEGGHVYVFFVYGMYYQFNIVTGPPDHPHAVLIRAVEPVEGIADLRAETLTGLPQVRITVDREAVARVGLAPADVVDALRIGLAGEEVSQVWVGQRRFDLVVRLADDDRRGDRQGFGLPPGPVRERQRQRSEPFRRRELLDASQLPGRRADRRVAEVEVEDRDLSRTVASVVNSLPPLDRAVIRTRGGRAAIVPCWPWSPPCGGCARRRACAPARSRRCRPRC